MKLVCALFLVGLTACTVQPYCPPAAYQSSVVVEQAPVTATASVEATPIAYGQVPSENHAVHFSMTADDAFDATIDGHPLMRGDTWRTAFQADATLSAGHHVLVIDARDVGRVISGVLFDVREGGRVIAQSAPGVGQCTVEGQPNVVASCGRDPWAGHPIDLRSTGAQWIGCGGCDHMRPQQYRIDFDL